MTLRRSAAIDAVATAVPPGRRRLALAAVAAATTVLVLRLAIDDAAAAGRFGGLAAATAAAIAAGATLAAAWVREGRSRYPRLLLAVGCGLWALDRAVQALRPVLPTDGVDATAAAQVGYAALVPLLGAAALLLVPPSPVREDGLKLTLDALIGLASLLTVAWFVALGPVWLETSAPRSAQALATVRGLGDVALLVVVLIVGLRLGRRPIPRVLGALAPAIVAFVVGDTLATSRWLDGRADPGVLAELAWVGGFLGIAAAGLIGRGRGEAEADQGLGFDAAGEEPVWRVLLPYPVAVALLALNAWQEMTHDLSRYGSWVPIGSLSVVAVIIVRQGLAVRDARRLNHRLSRQVDRDPLTGLINRRKVLERIDRELEHGRACGHPVALALVDVDDFKGVNDSLGHHAGDQVLQDLARILADGCRGTDVAARYAGDEFILVLPGLGLEDARGVGERVVRQVRERSAATSWTELGIGFSVGVAVTHRYLRSTRQLLAIADAAMYDAKEAGKGRVVVVDADTLSASGEPTAPPRRDLATFDRVAPVLRQA